MRTDIQVAKNTGYYVDNIVYNRMEKNEIYI